MISNHDNVYTKITRTPNTYKLFERNLLRFNMFDKTKKYLAKKELPTGDRYDLPTSDKRFPDGSQFRIEVPTVNSPETMRAILETAENHSVTVNRIDDTFGIMRNTDETILEYIDIAKEWGLHRGFE